MNIYRVLGWSAVGLLAFGAPALAQDGDCVEDADCGDGFVCEVVGGGGTDCPTIECFAEPCPQPDCQPTYTEIYGCVPAPCDADADCGDGQVCYAYTQEECSGDAGAACEETPDGVICDKPVAAEPECTTTTESVCAPTWALPCVEDSDCGTGFTCEEQESCWCSGSGGVPACAEGETCPEPIPAEEQCGCDPTGEFYCALVITECSADSDCDGNLICADNPESGTCSVDAGAADGAAGGAAGDGAPDGGASDAEPSCVDASGPARVCMPADFLIYGGGRGEIAYDSAASGGTAQDANGADGESDSGGNGGGGGSTVGLCSVGQLGSSGRGRSGAPLVWLAGLAMWLSRRRGA